MNVRFLQFHSHGSLFFRKGEVVKLGRQLAKRLVKQGIAVPTEKGAAQELMAAKKQVENAKQVIEEYPESAKDIIKRLRSETNENVIRYFTDDPRTTVSNAAKQRLK